LNVDYIIKRRKEGFMMKKLVILIAVGVMLTFGSFAYAVTDIIQAPTGYFVPSDADKYNETGGYYRRQSQDWGWNHNIIGGTITTATLSISAYDVDYAGQPGLTGERDGVYAYDDGVKTFLGYLAGSTDTWSYTTFTLSPAFYNDINSGLQVFFDIDMLGEGWAVSLAKSVLATEGSDIPGPEPGPVPEPLTMLLLGLGLTGLAGLRRRFEK
jgi:hypothetical protein